MSGFGPDPRGGSGITCRITCGVRKITLTVEETLVRREHIDRAGKERVNPIDDRRGEPQHACVRAIVVRERNRLGNLNLDLSFLARVLSFMKKRAYLGEAEPHAARDCLRRVAREKQAVRVEVELQHQVKLRLREILNLIGEGFMPRDAAPAKLRKAAVAAVDEIVLVKQAARGTEVLVA